MDPFYLFIVIVLFILAISDLIVGVSNDAVNFLNSAVGSKAANIKVILAVAALGVLVGATFSSGMMEVARKGIFNPEMYLFEEIMILFLAVMLTDVLLLDFYNTLGLPTSTTVSIVFELLGAAISIALMKISASAEYSLNDLGQFINTERAVLIISGIFLSVIVAFSVGSIIQYIARLAYSFQFKKNVKKFGAISGGLAIMAITYFMLIKGAKGASFMTSDAKDWIKDNTFLIMVISFLGWTLVTQLLMWFTKINILKMIVMIGTFSLAMAFAGNDLVNFIGVPLAGLESYNAFASGEIGIGSTMELLGEKVKTDTYLLLLAGLIMVLTLVFSKKSKSVLKTSLDLGRQNEGSERFHANDFSRAIVRISSSINKGWNYIMPAGVNRYIDSRFIVPPKELSSQEEGSAFDLIRAAVTLIVASVLIALGTSLKLPLSTTYVTFMVAMGTSLSDRAWGRDSAVYRVSGVVTVIGGWFFTAFSALTVAGIIAYLMTVGGIIVIIALILLAAFLLFRTHIHHKNKKADDDDDESIKLSDKLTEEEIKEKVQKDVSKILKANKKVFNNTYIGLSTEDRKSMKTVMKTVKKANGFSKELKDEVHLFIDLIKEEQIENGHHYVQIVDYQREIAHSLNYFAQPCYDHVLNAHQGFIDEQLLELKELTDKLIAFNDRLLNIVAEASYDSFAEEITQQQLLIEEIEGLRKKQLKRIKAGATGTKNSILFLNILQETKNNLLHTINLIKSHRDFSSQID